MRLALTPHPEVSSNAVRLLEVEVARCGEEIVLLYVVSGRIDDLLIPAPATPTRADGLWQHTCLEAFVRAPSEAGYREFNFSPSSRWAAYRFDGYRAGMTPLDIPPLRIITRRADGLFELEVVVRATGPLHLALSAVIEEKSGRKSWWALAHPAGKPDFHHPDSFICELT